MKKQTMIIGGLAAAIIFSGSALGAHAATGVHHADRVIHHGARVNHTGRVNHLSNHTNFRRVVHGTVDSVASDSFTLKTKTQTDTVKVSSATKLLDKSGKAMQLGDIQSGDSVNARGTFSGTDVSATLVRDLTR